MIHQKRKKKRKRLQNAFLTFVYGIFLLCQKAMAVTEGGDFLALMEDNNNV
jgi:hypothetical protein